MPSTKRQLPLVPQDVADQLGCHYLTALNLIRDGEAFPNAWCSGKGTHRRYKVWQSDVDAYIESLRISAAA